jgi:hypothetical protein
VPAGIALLQPSVAYEALYGFGRGPVTLVLLTPLMVLVVPPALQLAVEPFSVQLPP